MKWVTPEQLHEMRRVAKDPLTGVLCGVVEHLQTEVTTLRVDLDKMTTEARAWRQHFTEGMDERDALRARLARLEAALTPFAASGDCFSDYEDADEICDLWWTDATLTAGDVRRAQAALADGRAAARAGAGDAP